MPHSATDCPHPYDFRLTRVLDRGWGEIAFEYRWNSTSSQLNDIDGSDNSNNIPLYALNLKHCFLYELTTYTGNLGTYQDSFFSPPNPPFADWRFRDPTDGRTAPVALGYFAASQGWAWDRHKLGGRLVIPDDTAASVEPSYTITAIQQYRFHCERCGIDAPVPGAAAGPHNIVRAFAPLNPNLLSNPAQDRLIRSSETIWRYTLKKHDHQAALDINALGGYVDDSAHLGFGPW